MANFKIISSLLIATVIITILASPVFAAKQQVATPTFSPLPGTYSTGQSVRISCSTNGAKTYYTTDGSEPTSKSTAYSNPISVTTNMTIKAKAFKNSMTDSDTASATYTISFSKVATPTFSPSGGFYSSYQNVTLSCSTSGATIRYTTDGSEPTSKSTAYSNPISVTTNMTIKAKAFKNSMTDSDTVSATYTINISTNILPRVATPTFNPSSGIYSSSLSVTLSCSTSGATIRYTLDDSEPTSLSTAYTGPISVGSNGTIQAKAFKTGISDSYAAFATYTFEFSSDASNSVYESRSLALVFFAVVILSLIGLMLYFRKH